MHQADPRDKDTRTHTFPVSVKGVLLKAGRVVLQEDEREEWELPGGKLEEDETPEACVEREIAEELNLRVEIGPILDAWVYRTPLAGDVLVVTYGCTVEDPAPLEHSAEHIAVGTFHPDKLDAIAIPDGYRRAILAWFGSRAGDRP